MDSKPRTQIADVLLDEILRGQYRVGERLPSERDLASRFGVTRALVRVAVNRLEQCGIARIHPGGARVAPLEAASLEVIGRLLDLEHPPDPQLVSRVLEAHRGVAVMAIRLGVERATPEQIQQALDLIARIIAPRTSAEEQQRLEREIGELFVDASDNIVLKIVQRGLSMEFMRRLQREGLRIRPPRAKILPHHRELARALRARDTDAAVAAIEASMRLHHETVLSALRSARERAPRESAGGHRQEGRATA